MDAAARMAFNMKVLRRHDPHIDDIIESASFVVLYAHDGEWTKTGIEGPMFLYRRNTSPPYGFFILNRNGVENFSADLTPDDDLDLTPEFIIYRSGRSDDDDTYGIWVFEPGQRDSVGKQMVMLQQTPLDKNAQAVSVAHAAGVDDSKSAPSLAPSQQAGKSINLDALFGTVAANPSPAVAKAAPAAPAPAPPAADSNRPNGLALLDSMFQSVQSPKPPVAHRQPQEAPAPPAPAQKDDAAGLRALLGLGPSAPPQPAPPPAQQPSSKTSANGIEALMQKANLKSDAAKDEVPLTPALASEITNEAMVAKGRPEGGQVLERRDFVREVLSLIHTDPSFVDDLYGRYRRRVG